MDGDLEARPALRGSSFFGGLFFETPTKALLRTHLVSRKFPNGTCLFLKSSQKAQNGYRESQKFCRLAL
jgi:hypothetical protein